MEWFEYCFIGSRSDFGREGYFVKLIFSVRHTVQQDDQLIHDFRRWAAIKPRVCIFIRSMCQVKVGI